MKINQKGFGAVEGLLVLILISILGFTGYYVYHSQKSSDSSYKNAANVSSSTPTSSANASKKFVFKELGVEFDSPDLLKGLAYQNTDGFLYLYDDSYINALEKCSDYKTGDIGGGFAAVSKIAGQYPTNPTLEDGGLLKQFPDFYISYGVPNGNGCADLGQSQNLGNTGRQEANAFFQAFQKTGSVIQ
jgi:hypothetical protein